MKLKLFSALILSVILFFFTMVSKPTAQPAPNQYKLSQRAMSLNNRYPVKSVNDVMKDNILLNLEYMVGKVKDGTGVNWSDIEKPASFEVVLYPHEVFTFHDDVLPEYKGKVSKTTNAHFNSADGFKSDGYLTGDGVCHLASLLYWAVKDAGLTAIAPTNHDFATIPEVPKEYGVSIYYYPGQSTTNALQNLYIVNNKENDVHIRFDYDGDNLKVGVFELI